MKNSLNWLNIMPTISSMQSPPSDVFFLFFCKSCFHLVNSCQWNSYRAGVLSERSQQKRQIHQERRAFPGSGIPSGEGNGNPLQYSCLGNPIDRGAWWATVHGSQQSRTRLHDRARTDMHIEKESRWVMAWVWQWELSTEGCGEPWPVIQRLTVSPGRWYRG